ncbi:hypothetical protein XELAEV_18009571mg [Xenopus laevis]|uniref:Uncharacterized protein n=1 Tax=Xenopus laevis TaxID=8355 RepID=A0A974DSY8_XENLA|nr:hypothetical protein XELAEV_18009571mg [Xenopus laevis]
METTVKAWQLAQKLLTPTGLTYHSPHAPLWCNKLLPHLLTNQDYKFWASNGLRYVKDLYHEGELKSFLELKASYPTQHVTQFRYDQLRHAAQAQFSNPQSTIVATSLEKALQLQVVAKLLSAIYHSLLAPEEKRPLKCFQKCVRDIANLDEESWELIMRHMLATTISARDKLIQLKFMHRSKLTPVRLHHMDPTRDQNCTRGCGHPGTWFHMLLMFYARKMIVLRWNKKEAPKLEYWKDLVNKALPYYKAVYMSRGCTDKFIAIWMLWVLNSDTNSPHVF